MNIYQRTRADNLCFTCSNNNNEKRFYVLWYYIYINYLQYELDKHINKNVLWFFEKLVLQKFTKTHDHVCCTITPRYNLLQEKQQHGIKKHYTSIKKYIRFYKYMISVESIYTLVYHLLGCGVLPHPLYFDISSIRVLRSN